MFDEIRDRIYEKTKGMSDEECMRYYRRRGAEIAEKNGFRIIASANDV